MQMNQRRNTMPKKLGHSEKTHRSTNNIHHVSHLRTLGVLKTSVVAKALISFDGKAAPGKAPAQTATKVCDEKSPNKWFEVYLNLTIPATAERKHIGCPRSTNPIHRRGRRQVILTRKQGAGESGGSGGAPRRVSDQRRSLHWVCHHRELNSQTQPSISSSVATISPQMLGGLIPAGLGGVTSLNKYKRRRSDKGDAASHIKYVVATKRKVLDWRVLLSSERTFGTFRGDRIILLTESMQEGSAGALNSVRVGTITLIALAFLGKKRKKRKTIRASGVLKSGWTLMSKVKKRGSDTSDTTRTPSASSSLRSRRANAGTGIMSLGYVELVQRTRRGAAILSVRNLIPVPQDGNPARQLEVLCETVTEKSMHVSGSTLLPPCFCTSKAENLQIDVRRRKNEFVQGEPGSIPSGVTPAISHVGIVLVDAAGRGFSSGISRFPRPCIPPLLRTHLTSPSQGLKASILRAAHSTATEVHLYCSDCLAVVPRFVCGVNVSITPSPRIEVDMKQYRNARARETGNPRKKSADQRHRPVRFAHVKIRGPHCRASDPVLLGEGEWSAHYTSAPP
ncbi:hypothetical protein PR048_002913 [Dryococelus australis]|uniref:Uncharacterized protein n=1 Tax=Dryococelus australis TaxID=614101 RepID=A0ABQ9IMY7_9NEOP|nr:hypothetical protein PR048_002913 [Dryococelus australis]